MRKTIGILALAAVLSACNKQFDNAMKSADKAVILKTADELYAKKKWKEALQLYDRASKLVAGTDDYPNMLFHQAYANYYDKSYRIAASQFKSFSVNFAKDARAEEAAYMAALCYYKGSLDYNLDQTSTESAINELQDFLNNYPNSERSKNIRELIDELSYKTEFKAYENARQYFRMAEYKAANVAFENVLSDFPATKLRPQIYDYIMKSRYELALNSIYDLKEERIESALAFTRTVEKELPGTEYSKTAADLRTKLGAEKERFAKLKAQVEEQRARIEKKQQAEAARQDIRQKKHDKTRKDVEVTEAEAAQIRTDSAQATTPPPAATLKIPN